MRKDNDQRIYLTDDNTSVVYLKNVIDDPDIQVGEHTYYHDERNDPRDFVKNNILYHYPQFHRDTIIIGKLLFAGHGTTFLCPIANHNLPPWPIIPFPSQTTTGILPESFGSKVSTLKGPTIVGNDVWFGYESVIMPGVHIGDGAIIGANSVVGSDIPPYSVAAGNPCRVIRPRFDRELTEYLLKIRWWDWSPEKIFRSLEALCSGDLTQIRRIEP